MNLHTLVVLLAVFLGTVAFLAGVILAIRLLVRYPEAGVASVGGPFVALLLAGVGGALVSTALVTAAIVADRETDLIRLRGISRALEAKLRVYEIGLAHLERAVAAAQRIHASGDQVAVAVRQELALLRHGRAALP